MRQVRRTGTYCSAVQHFHQSGLTPRAHFRLLANYMALPFKSKINHKDTKNTEFFLEISVRSVVNPYLEPVKGRWAFVVPRAS